MENSLFWDAEIVDGEYDRTYSSDDFAALFEGFWNTGIIPNGSTPLLVSPVAGGMAVSVSAGKANIKGRLYTNSAPVTLTLKIGDSAARVDFIALRMDKSSRTMKLRILEGVAGEGEPTHATGEALYDLLLAKVTVPAYATEVKAENITDLRGSASCPWISANFDIDALTTKFNTWFETTKSRISAITEQKLQTEIDTINSHAPYLQNNNLYIYVDEK